MALGFTELEKVRNKTTSDTDALSDDQIGQFLAEYGDKSSKVRVLRASADAIEYLLRDVTWNSMTLNSRRVEGNIRLDNVKLYRAQARALDLKFV